MDLHLRGEHVRQRRRKRMPKMEDGAPRLSPLDLLNHGSARDRARGEHLFAQQRVDQRALAALELAEDQDLETLGFELALQPGERLCPAVASQSVKCSREPRRKPGEGAAALLEYFKLRWHLDHGLFRLPSSHSEDQILDRCIDVTQLRFEIAEH